MKNMSGFIVGLLMIFFISGQTEAQGFDDAVELIKKLYEWGMKIYGTVDKYQNPDRTKQNIVDILNKVNEISTQIDAMESHLNIKLDALLTTLLADIRLESTLNPMRTKIRHCFSKIDKYFDDAIQYKLGGAFANQTLRDFAFKALWSTGSVPDLLDDLHEVYIPGGLENDGYISVLLERTMVNILHDCNKDVSTQQHLYYIFFQTFISEVKGLIVRIQAVMIQRYFDVTTADYSSELEKVKKSFQKNIRQYTSLFTTRIPDFPKHIRRCDANPPVLGSNYIELQKFFRLHVLDTEFVKQRENSVCPSGDHLISLAVRTNTTIDNCINIGDIVTACLAEPRSHHEYLWLRNQNGTQYGPKTTCRNEKKLDGGPVNSGPYASYATIKSRHPICACETSLNGDQNDETSIWRVSVTPQYSDFFNDKVVTGVKFVTKDNALHLQIQQAALSQSGMAYDRGSWKDLEIGFHDAGFRHTKTPMNYVKLTWSSRILYLDDVKAPDGFVVTGVKLDAVDSSAFMLSIYVCPFDFNLGEVNPFGCIWINGFSNPMDRNDYGTERPKIEMGNADSPTRSSEFQYELKSHKQIEFTHTDLYKDAGQTTIPLLDAQPVVTSPPFPLSGIGLSFRGRDGYAGYVAPRIFTFDFANYMKFPTINLH